MIKKLIFILSISCYINISYAFSKIYIFHINGVNTTLKDALQNAVSLHNNGISYAIYSTNPSASSAKPIFIDPNGVDLACTNSDECEKLNTPYVCWYVDAYLTTTCEVFFNSRSGTYSALQPLHSNWYFSVGNSNFNHFYCFDNPHCAVQSQGMCLKYEVNTIQSDQACHMLENLDGVFDYQSVLPQMFTNGYYKAFWINN